MPLLKRWQWILLLFELVLFAVILILPQVDLPDFTFHKGTGPGSGSRLGFLSACAGSLGNRCASAAGIEGGAAGGAARRFIAPVSGLPSFLTLHLDLLAVPLLFKSRSTVSFSHRSNFIPMISCSEKQLMQLVVAGGKR